MSIDASIPLSLGVPKARRASNERNELRSCESEYRAIGAEPLGAPKARKLIKEMTKPAHRFISVPGPYNPALMFGVQDIPHMTDGTWNNFTYPFDRNFETFVILYPKDAFSFFLHDIES